MYSVHDPSKRGVAPFGYLGIKACSRLPQDFRSVPRPSSPSSAKASTRCPSHTQNQRIANLQQPKPPEATHPQSLAQDPSNRRQNLSMRSKQFTYTHNHIPQEPTGFIRDNGLRTKRPQRRQLIRRSTPTPESPRTPQGTQQNQIHNQQRTHRPQPQLRSDLAHRRDPTLTNQHTNEIDVMETVGIEPTTPCLQSRCSPS